MRWSLRSHPAAFPSRGRRRLKPGWPLLVGLLILVNVYLFGIRGMPSDPSPPQGSVNSPTPRGEATASTPARGLSQGNLFVSSLGEMRGVAGVRSPTAPPDGPRPHRSSLRFDLGEARGVSGQRTLEGWCERAEGQVDRGEHFASALLREGIDLDQIHELVTALKPVMEFRHCREGDRFTLLRSPSGRTERFVYRQSPLLSFQAHRRGSRLLGKRVEERSEVEVASIAVRVDGSLYASLEGAGETAALVMLIVDIFAWDIDFYVDTRRGDTVRLLVEKHRLNGQFVRYGRILAAEYRGEVGNRRAFYYESDKEGGATGYYDAEGGSLRKAFLKSPLKFVRVTSGFGMRVHPILGFSAMHAGIDFAAPTGTPVWAPADGAVTFSGAKGANGNLVTLRHANGYETAYAHLQSIARGVRTGARVRQKQIIGYVGNTGRSTGPHLHFGMRRHGKEINPLKQTFPPADPVPKAELPRYLQVTAPLLEKLLAIPLASLRTATLGAGAKGTG